MKGNQLSTKVVNSVRFTIKILFPAIKLLSIGMEGVATIPIILSYLLVLFHHEGATTEAWPILPQFAGLKDHSRTFFRDVMYGPNLRYVNNSVAWTQTHRDDQQ